MSFIFLSMLIRNRKGRHGHFLRMKGSLFVIVDKRKKISLRSEVTIYLSGVFGSSQKESPQWAPTVA